MKKIVALAASLLVLLSACSTIDSESNISSSQSTTLHSESSNSASENFGDFLNIDLLDVMDATNIEYIEPFDGNKIYIIGAKRDKSLPARELIYAVCNLDSAVVTVLHRDFLPIDWAYNMAVYRANDGTHKVYTGQQILLIKDDKLIGIEKLNQSYLKEAFLDIEKSQMVHTNNEPPSAYYRNINGDESVTIYEAKYFTDENGKESVLFPYNPKFNDKGDKVLFGIAKNSSMEYQNVAISSISGKLLALTDRLDIRADFLDFLWYKDGFITLELTDQYEQSPTRLATIFSQYDINATFVKKTVLQCMALSCQRKFYRDTNLYAFGYKTDKMIGVAIYDPTLDQAYSIHKANDYIVSPTVTPDGKKVLWIEDGKLYCKLISHTANAPTINIIK